MSEQNPRVVELRTMRAHTESEIERLKQEMMEQVEPASAADDDSADVAADIYERGKLISMISSLEIKLRSLDRAIEIAARGKYGICEKCGAEIPAERLEIVPETTLCVKCAGQLEQGIRRHQIITAATETSDPFDEFLSEGEEESFDED